MQQFQASNEELSKLTSIASIQTKGLKRHFFEEAHPEKLKPKKNHFTNEQVKLNSISGSKRKKLMTDIVQQSSSDLNIVGFESSDTSDSESENETPLNEVGGNQVEPINKHEEDVSENDNIEDVDIVEHQKEVIEIKDEVNVVNKSQPVVKFDKPAVYVHVVRSEEIQKIRSKLPIIAEEQQIMETVNENSIIILAGMY